MSTAFRYFETTNAHGYGSEHTDFDPEINVLFAVSISVGKQNVVTSSAHRSTTLRLP